MRLALIRHGVTAWNAQGRIQGRTDIPLSEEGIAEMARLSPPDGFSNTRAFTSPLLRARQTAELLGLSNVQADERLAEHFWGVWEGLTREEILSRHGIDAFRHAGNALDFCPLEGETTRDFMARVADFLSYVSRENSDAIAITHRGVMRSAYALATGWDMKEPMPPDMDVSCALVVELDENGAAKLAALNVPLKPRKA